MTEYKQESKGFKYDFILLFSVLFLVGGGIVMIYSASSALAMKKFGSEYYFLKKQIFFALAGIGALFICARFPYRYYRFMTYPLLIFSIIILVAISFTELGYSAGGATRWFSFGWFRMQPSELARFSMIIYLAYSIHKKNGRLREFSIGFLPHVIVLVIFSVLIMLQPDFGFVAIMGAITWIMLFVGGGRIFHLSSSLFCILPLAYFVMISAEYRLKRLLVFLDPWPHKSAEGYQIVHSLMAFGSGGILGEGIGKGYQKLFYLPEPHTDFIFSVIGEELGLVGVMTVIVLYGLIIWRGIRIAEMAKDNFGSFLALGLTMVIGLQACVNMGVTLGLLPTKGLTLPFLSYGGTSLLISMASVGILMNIEAAGST